MQVRSSVRGQRANINQWSQEWNQGGRVVPHNAATGGERACGRNVCFVFGVAGCSRGRARRHVYKMHSYRSADPHQQPHCDVGATAHSVALQPHFLAGSSGLQVCWYIGEHTKQPGVGVGGVEIVRAFLEGGACD